jgi:hypothetical protein
MAPEFVAGAAQLLLLPILPIDAERSEQLCTGITG